jgi:hypothetical protein
MAWPRANQIVGRGLRSSRHHVDGTKPEASIRVNRLILDECFTGGPLTAAPSMMQERERRRANVLTISGKR